MLLWCCIANGSHKFHAAGAKKFQCECEHNTVSSSNLMWLYPVGTRDLSPYSLCPWVKHCFKWQSAKEPFLRYGQNCRYWMFKTLHGFSMSSLLCVIVGLPGWFPLFLSLCATLAKPNNSWLKFYTSHRDLRVVLIVQFNIRHERQFRCFPQISNYTCISFSSLSCCSSC